MADAGTLLLCSRVPIVWPLQQFYCVFWMILCKWSWVTVWLPFSFPLEPRRFPKLLSMFYGRMSCTCAMIVLRENLNPFWTKVSHSLCISCVVKQDLVRTIILSSVFSLVRKERRWGEKVNLKMYHTDAEATSIFAVSAADERLINFYT